MTTPSRQVEFSIDRGGTFTDIVYRVVDVSEPLQHTAAQALPAAPSAGADAPSTTDSPPRVRFVKEGVLKLLSRDPDHYSDAPSEGIRRVLIAEGLLSPASTTGGDTIPTAAIRSIKMGTTVATNALLEHNGAPFALLVTKGFEDVLRIGNQARPHIFKLDIVKPKQLYAEVVEVTERLRLLTPAEDQQTLTSDEIKNKDSIHHHGKILRGTSGLAVEELVPVDAKSVRAELERLFHQCGLRSVAISLMHAYACGQHEDEVAAIAKDVGFTQISVSHRLMPVIKYVNRTTTAAVDAYLTPLIAAYIETFRARFENNLMDMLDRVFFIQSDGGLTSTEGFCGFKAVLSGPAGGVVGCSATTCADLGDKTQMVGFDMGGTSTDVCRCEGRDVEQVLEAEIAGVSVLAPQVDVTTVAAGGGSILRWVNGMYEVGPESAGAFPGPACYGRGGPLTVTDANVLLGRVDASRFPCVFGASGKEPLNVEAARTAFEALRGRIAADIDHKEISTEEVASGFLEIANETMCRAIRNVTEARGCRSAEHVLTVFGGAGSQHACAVARKLGMSRVYIHRNASVLSAVGIGLSDIVREELAPFRRPIIGAMADVSRVSAQLVSAATAKLLTAEEVGSGGKMLEVTEFLLLRYEGTATSLMVRRPTVTAPAAVGGRPDESAPSHEVVEHAYVAALEALYKKQFGFSRTHAKVLVDEVRVRVVRKSDTTPPGLSPYTHEPYGAASTTTAAVDTTRIYDRISRQWETVPVYPVVPNAAPLHGPCMLLLEGTFVPVEGGCTAFFTPNGNVVLHASAAPLRLTTALHPLPLSLFAHRFMSIAEQMGTVLQRTASSTNIKERLDFSCALFDKEGNLVANAPHIPVHLGAMGATVRWQRDLYGDQWHEGDVMLSNHPGTGGSHLPDITVMTPCFINGKVEFYVASRGHHADVGGVTPASMPPFSTSLDEEGAHIKTFRLVRDGIFQEAGITELLLAPGRLPGCSGCRMLADVLADLRAQVAANHRGIELMQALVQAYGSDVVRAYMGHIQDAAESATRAALQEVVRRTKKTTCHYKDAMDSGSEIDLKLAIDPESGSAVFDFSGSGPQVLGSTNCPKAVVASAVIYAMRSLIARDIPLNQGCLKPVRIITRPHSILDPDDGCAVVAGNVLTSQRVTDVILMALEAAACSQGCMNNFTMGTATTAYYETIAGGAGATPQGPGASAVQVHMTNTRMTDAEVLEERYPVLLRSFAIRRQSGGSGHHAGGDGVVRSILFLKPMSASIISERRVLRPRGLLGGGDAACGRNMLLKRSTDATTTTTTTAAATTSIHGLSVVAHSVSARDLWECDAFTEAKPSSLSPIASEHTGNEPWFRAVDIGAKATLQVQPGDVITILTPGGGGYGRPSDTVKEEKH